MRRKVALETSHYSIQEVDQRAGTQGYRAAGPILPDRLRVCEGGSAGREQCGAGRRVLDFFYFF